MMLSGLKFANKLCREGRYLEAYEAYRLLCLRKGGASDANILWNMEYCEKKSKFKVREPRMESGNSANDLKKVPVVVVLTTIKARLNNIKKVLKSLHEQTCIPEKIILFLSREPYLLDDGIHEDDLHMVGISDLPLVEIRWVANSGPYRKIVPYVAECLKDGADSETLFITVDDDTLYPEYFIETLLVNYFKYNCVVAFRGRKIGYGTSLISPYSEWGWGEVVPTYANIPTGKDGVLYALKFFNKSFIDLGAALRCAPTADDLWIKWHTTLNGVKSVILNPEACSSDYKSFPLVDYSEEGRNTSLYRAHNKDGNESRGKNDLAVELLENASAISNDIKLYDLISA